MAVVRASDVRVGIIAACAGITMLAFEYVLGLRYSGQWRQLV